MRQAAAFFQKGNFDDHQSHRKQVSVCNNGEFEKGKGI
jgi:hypothetical protein